MALTRITTGIIADNTLAVANIADNAVDATKIASNSILTRHIDDDQITGDQLADNITLAGTLGVTGVLSPTTHLDMPDNAKIKLGTGDDLQIYHDGSDTFIEDASGTGNLYVLSNQFIINNAAGTENMARFAQDGAVTLYYNHAAKLATTSTGIDVTGAVVADGLTVDGGGSRQYINSGHVRLSDDYNLEWGGGTNYIRGSNSSGDMSLIAASDLTLDVGGDIILDADGADFKFQDGGSEFLRVSRDGSGNTVFQSIGQNKSVYFSGDDAGAGINALRLDMSLAGRAYFNAGASFQDNVNLADNDKLILGTHDDLQIFHDGSNSYIQSATGGFNITTAGGNEFALNAVNDGAVSLYYNGSAKFATASGGVTVTGNTVTNASGGVATLGANGHVTSKQSLDTATAGGRFIGESNRGHLGEIAIEQTANSTDGGYIRFATSASGSTSSTTHMTIDSTGDLTLKTAGKRYYIPRASDAAATGSLYSPTGNEIRLSGAGSSSGVLSFEPSSGSGVAMHIDTSGDVLIGQTSQTGYTFAEKLVVGDGDANDGITIQSGSTHQGNLAFNHSDGTTAHGRISYQHNSNYMSFFTNNEEKVRIDAAGALWLKGGTTTGVQDLAFQNSYHQLADNAALTISSARNTGCMIAVGSYLNGAAGITYNHGLFFGDYGSNNAMIKIADPSGTFGVASGTDNLINVVVSGNSDIVIENKSGAVNRLSVALFRFLGL